MGIVHEFCRRWAAAARYYSLQREDFPFCRPPDGSMHISMPGQGSSALKHFHEASRVNNEKCHLRAYQNRLGHAGVVKAQYAAHEATL